MFDRDYYQDREIDEVRQQMRRGMLARSKRASKRSGEVIDLEAEVLFLSLLNRALIDVLVSAKLTTLDDVAARMKQLDRLDGEADGGLEPDVLADELGVEKPEIDKAKRFAKSLKKKRKR